MASSTQPTSSVQVPRRLTTAADRAEATATMTAKASVTAPADTGWELNPTCRVSRKTEKKEGMPAKKTRHTTSPTENEACRNKVVGTSGGLPARRMRTH